jgi:hypothetical protein
MLAAWADFGAIFGVLVEHLLQQPGVAGIVFDQEKRLDRLLVHGIMPVAAI